jgi:hypothetical protein
MASIKKEAAATEPNIAIAEFCSRLSESDRRVELISAFYNYERSGGLNNDTFDNYSARFKSFINQPA